MKSSPIRMKPKVLEMRKSFRMRLGLKWKLNVKPFMHSMKTLANKPGYILSKAERIQVIMQMKC